MAARLLATPALILMPADTPSVKLDATRAYGADVVLYERMCDDREAMGAALIEAHGYTLIPPFDDAQLIAGQGTAAMELLQEVGPLDVLLTTLGGGGLLAGSALAAHHRAPRCRVIGVEPTASDDGQQSLSAGRIVRIAPPQALPEGALGTHVGRLNFAIMQRHVDDVVRVDNQPVIDAMRFPAERMKLIVGPTGALPVAALLERRLPVSGLRVGVVLSGGNVDFVPFATLMAP